MFSVAKFDDNNTAETTCKQLFSSNFEIKKKRKNKGKVEKKYKKREVISKNKQKETGKKLAKPLEHEQKLKKKIRKSQLSNIYEDNTENASQKIKRNKKKKNKNRETPQPVTHTLPKNKSLTLRERMLEKLKGARFRYINEQIYSSDGKVAEKIFHDDPESFKAYHEGYRQQVNKWPINPVDNIIKSIQKMPKTHIVADFGCGDAKLAKSVPQKVHSFDLVAGNDAVIACNMAHVPLENNSIDVVVFCLSLMGTNLHEYLLEANRVLKIGGLLKIAEVESRFENVKQFIEGVRKFHFKNVWQDLSHNLFYFLDFKKESNIQKKKNLPSITLNPCLYKKR